MNTQFKKGVLQLCVLTLLKQRPYYGYELVGAISTEIHISEGTIYPLLRRLKAEGFVDTYLEESTEGPSRKYYRITEQGEEEQRSQLEEWLQFRASVERLMHIKANKEA